jgi:hypothetical protein
MKKVFIFLLGVILSAQTVYSQSSLQVWTENFDGTVSFTASPPGAWVANSTYVAPNSVGSNSKSYLGKVPNAIGATTVLQTPMYNFTGMDFVYLRFSQICKISPQDTAQIQYRRSGMTVWEDIDVSSYLGEALNYSTRGFHAGSYNDWQANDSNALPQHRWWKEEAFDLSNELKLQSAEFRFIIRHGSVRGTQASYGWLLDNFELRAATAEIYPPVVEFIVPVVKDTAYGTGPWEINVRTSTLADQPWFVYTATLNGSQLGHDSIPLTPVVAGSLWKATIPKFVLGAEVYYSVTGKTPLAIKLLRMRLM